MTKLVPLTSERVRGVFNEGTPLWDGTGRTVGDMIREVFNDWKETRRLGMKPKIVCIIGSSKFKAQELGIAQRETLLGKVALVHGFWHHVDMVPITNEQKNKIDELMLSKIDMADEVFVVNVNGYVGASTQRGIDYAQSLGKPVKYLEGT